MIDQYKPAEFLRHICHAEIKKPEIRNIPEIRRKSGSLRCKSTKSETHTQTMRKSNQMQLCKGGGDHKNHGVSKRETFLELLFANEHRANFAICRAGNEVGAAFAKSKERTPPALFSLDLLQVSLSLSYRSTIVYIT
jgi:hypothetical protein